MSAPRISLRFWAAMPATPAALASAASCGGPSSDARRPAHPGPRRRKPLCGVDQYPVGQCLDWKANDCPASPPPSRTIVRSLFGGRKNGRLDPDWTATADKGTCCYDWRENIAITKTPNTICAPGHTRRVECFPMPEKGTTAPAAAPYERCPVGVVTSLLNGVPGSFEGAFSVPMTAGRAQRVAEGAEPCCAARHDGEVIVAPPIDDQRSWCEGPRAVPGLTLEDAFYEHASAIGPAACPAFAELRGIAEVREKIERASRAVERADDALARWAHANVIEPCTEVLLS